MDGICIGLFGLISHVFQSVVGPLEATVAAATSKKPKNGAFWVLDVDPLRSS